VTYLLDSTVELSFVSFIPQLQQNNTDRAPLWIWILVIFLVILVGVIWTLREEEEQKQMLAPASPRPDTIPEPVVTPKVAMPPEPVAVVESPPVEASPHEVPPTIIESPPVEAPPSELPSAVVEPPPVAEPKPVVPRKASPPKPDDLKKIKGIGLKISQQLNLRGIYTYEQLANTKISYLEHLMDELDWHVNDPVSWPEQARQLAEEKRRKQEGG
jgi:predicted flap endonuclease-1-like 5' DNA nuclease